MEIHLIYTFIPSGGGSSFGQTFFAQSGKKEPSYNILYIHAKTNLLVGSWPLLLLVLTQTVGLLYHLKRVIWLKVIEDDTDSIFLSSPRAKIKKKKVKIGLSVLLQNLKQTTIFLPKTNESIPEPNAHDCITISSIIGQAMLIRGYEYIQKLNPLFAGGSGTNIMINANTIWCRLPLKSQESPLSNSIMQGY